MPYIEHVLTVPYLRVATLTLGGEMRLKTRKGRPPEATDGRMPRLSLKVEDVGSEHADLCSFPRARRMNASRSSSTLQAPSTFTYGKALK